MGPVNLSTVLSAKTKSTQTPTHITISMFAKGTKFAFGPDRPPGEQLVVYVFPRWIECNRRERSCVAVLCCVCVCCVCVATAADLRPSRRLECCDCAFVLSVVCGRNLGLLLGRSFDCLLFIFISHYWKEVCIPPRLTFVCLSSFG
jgi:hypothetical protein